MINDTKDLRNKLESLSNYDATEGLPEWESNFVGSVLGQLEARGYDVRSLSSKQLDKIEELYERRIAKNPNDRFAERKNRY